MTLKTIDLSAARSPDAVSALQAAAIALHSAWSMNELENALSDGGLSHQFVAFIDSFISAYDAYIDVVGRSHPFQCQSGCSACCTDNPRGVTGVELLRLYAILRQRDDYHSIRSKIKFSAESFRELVDRKGDPAQAQIAWKRLGRYCPLLSKEGLCSVYEKRPIPCRMFVSLTPPDWCNINHPMFASAINPHLEPLPPMRRLLLDIDKRLGLADLPSDLFGGLDALATLLEDEFFLMPSISSESANRT